MRESDAAPLRLARDAHPPDVADGFVHERDQKSDHATAVATYAGEKRTSIAIWASARALNQWGSPRARSATAA